MKKARTLFAALLAVALLLGLCACGEEEGSGKKDDAGDLKSAIALCEQDETYLKEQGYTTIVYSAYLDSYAAEFGVDVKTLARAMKAYNNDGDKMMVYYFRTEAQAKAAYEKDASAYKLVGIRVVQDDPQNLIK
ncbi:MAG: hypothetical protein IJR89_02905 [Clostridia bacterium]|nr:hypothetical protein [Clostridia bacterium]